MAKKRSGRGFTLIELLIVVAIIGILSGISIVLYSVALNRARQKRTASDMRTIATAWEQRAADTSSYFVAGYTFPTVDIPFEDLRDAIVPTYARSIPQYDGWGYQLEFAAGPDKSDWAIRSRGRDGLLEGNAYEVGETDSPDCDMVFANGMFMRYPGVVQQK